jgi:hypothetical protein
VGDVKCEKDAGGVNRRGDKIYFQIGRRRKCGFQTNI